MLHVSRLTVLQITAVRLEKHTAITVIYPNTFRALFTSNRLCHLSISLHHFSILKTDLLLLCHVSLQNCTRFGTCNPQYSRLFNGNSRFQTNSINQFPNPSKPFRVRYSRAYVVSCHPNHRCEQCVFGISEFSSFLIGILIYCI